MGRAIIETGVNLLLPNSWVGDNPLVGNDRMKIAIAITAAGTWQGFCGNDNGNDVTIDALPIEKEHFADYESVMQFVV